MTSAAEENELLEISEPPWLEAQEIWLRGEQYISVYRSLLVRDSDPIYGPVAGRLRGAKLIIRHTQADEDMMFGRAEWLLYKLKK